MEEYLLLLGADQFLRERSYAGGKLIGDFQIWTAIKGSKYKYNAYFDFCIDAGPLSYEDIKNKIDYYKTQGYEPKSIVPLNDWTLKVANKLNKDYGLPYLDDEVVEACRNKYLMKEVFEKADIPTPKSKLFETIEQLKELIQTFEFPVIIKPVDFGGSGGVYLAHNEAECKEAYMKSQKVMAAYADSFKVSKNTFLIEAFIDSNEEVSVEVLCGENFYEVITVTEKYLSPRPWFTEMGHLVPSHRYKDENIKKLAIQSCKSLGINRGVAHIEIKIKDNNLYVIEAAARPGGDAIMDLVESSYSINPYQLHISMYINNKLKPPFTFRPNSTSAIAFMKAQKGKITNINFPDISKDTKIKRISLLKNIGDIISDPENWSSRDGLVQFSWPELPTTKIYKHINKANDLANKNREIHEVALLDSALGVGMALIGILLSKYMSYKWMNIFLIISISISVLWYYYEDTIIIKLLLMLCFGISFGGARIIFRKIIVTEYASHTVKSVYSLGNALGLPILSVCIYLGMLNLDLVWLPSFILLTILLILLKTQYQKGAL